MRYYVVLFIYICGCYGRVEIEKYLKICDRDSPDVNDCLAEAIQEALKTLSRGIPELEVPPIDPYEQDKIHLEYKNNQIRAQMDMKNLHVEGLKKAKIQGVRLKADDDRFHLEIDVRQPKVFIKGDYHGEGQYNSLRVNTDGQFNVTMRDLVFTWKLDGVPEQRDGETYMRIISFYMRPDIGNFRSYVSNIFPENPQLTEAANAFANQNWRILYRELLPYAQDNWNKIGTHVANTIFSKVPYDQLFPVKS